MKLFLAATFTLLTFMSLNAQDDSNCYQEYAKIFETRGANFVEDGTYDDVVITVRKGTFADCFIGKVTVSNGKIDGNNIQIQMIDKTFEPLDKKSKYDKFLKITNGISKTMVTVEDELINVMFVKSIKPKRKAYNRAPSPTMID
ncbi:hypothetical protein [Acidiluteibacter ferrifornacis]|uniref:Uncharacterized protein n=1 Tax=Acidiluteibacter ferrifornacis TaxID=2692424 RepID=A0A6N9NQ73_9FLAO|nr:hypothetical protein [Acidiluteibacter ferrifornacis]NBG66545.1 hypothetical protein [Acidiluteibacter ferrifornacis]